MKKYAIHKDFFLLSFLTVKIHPLFIAVMNFFIRLQCKVTRPKAGLKWRRQTLTSADGQCFDVTVIESKTLQQKKKPLIIYYHGGAFALACAANHIRALEYYVQQTDSVGIMVDYRLMPKHVFPAGFNDCYQSLEWAIKQADTLGIDTDKIVLMGDSAGGTLAAGVAQKARDAGINNILSQVLIYPALDYSCSTATAREYKNVPVWTTAANINMWDMYLQALADELPDYASPSFGALHDLPRCYIETAEFDPLRNEAENYALALEKEGVEVTMNATTATVHGFDAITYSAITQQAMLDRVAYLRQCFSSPS
ncbi:MAG: alpha/beta hydrolase [Pseudomonadales bacterium]|nr:alpha/beta hydrolase [Pseudomonadales bacterium]